MEWVVFALVAAGALAVVVGRRRGAIRRLWDTARRFGLEAQPDASGGARARGTFQGFGLELRAEAVRDEEDDVVGWRMIYALDARGSWPPKLKLEPATTRAASALTGDRRFDETVRIVGDLGVALAVLDAPTRRAVVAFFAKGGRIHDGRLRRECEEGTDDGARTRAIHEMVGIAKRLTRESRSKFEPLAHNAASDPLVDVRCANLACAWTLRPNTDEAIAMCERALDDEHPALRLAAAERLGDRGFETLDTIARSDDVRADLAVRALECLAERVPASLPPLVEALSRPHLDSVRVLAALELSRARGIEVGTNRLIALLGAESSEVQCAAVARLTESRRAAPDIAARLEHLAPDAALAACRALSVFGGVEAVVPLRALTRGVLRDRALAEAAALAITTIQDRARAAPGRLSVVDAADGGLALTPDAGALSEPED